MALPTPNSAWPPEDFVPALDVMRVHDALYSGDMAFLQEFYSRGEVARATHQHKGESYRGGFRGIFGTGMSRLFWGKPVNGNARRTVSHMPLAADIATMKSDMLWAEPPTFLAQTQGTTGRTAAPKIQQGRADLILNSDDHQFMLNEGGEMTSALGGLFYRVNWNTELRDHVWVEAVDADSAIPEYRGGMLDAVNFWTTHQDDRFYWRHLERHERGYIIHALYLGEERNVGTPVPIQSHPSTESWADLPGTTTGDNFEVVIPTGLDRLTVTYEPNVRRNREFRRAGGLLSQIGRSDFQGVESKFAELDEGWSSYLRDLKLGRARVFVTEDMLSTGGPGSGARFDEEQEIFTQMSSLGEGMSGIDGATMSAQQFAIRWQEHERFMLTATKVILRSAGLGTRDYDEGTGMMTATGELRRDKREETTRDKRKRYAAQATGRIGSVALEMDGIVFPGRGGGPGILIDVDFPVESQVDSEKEARVIGLLNAARAISQETMIRRANPEWKDTEIREEMAKIEKEQKAITMADVRPDGNENDDLDEELNRG